MLITYTCAGCNKDFFNAVGATQTLDQAPPRVDDVLLCAGCGRPNVVTLEGTRLMTEEEFDALTEEERADLDFVQRSLLVEKRAPRNGKV